MNLFFIYLLKASLLLIIFYLVYESLLKKETLFITNRFFLLTGLFCSVFLPFAEFTQVQYIQIYNFANQETSFSPETISDPEIGISFWSVLFFIYILGVVILTIRLCLQLKSLFNLLKCNSKKTIGKYTFVEVEQSITPFSFFNFIVYNPKLHAPEEMQMILKHEKVHVLQLHTLDVLLVNLITIFQWFNPFAWLYKKSLSQNLEFIADHNATNQIESKKEYQLTLLKISVNNHFTLTNNFYQSLIKKRIVMLNKQKSNSGKAWKTSIILPLIALFLWSFNTKQITILQPSPIANLSSSDTNSWNTQTIQFVINKNSSDQEIQKTIDILREEYELKAKFKSVKRNSKNEIIAISIHITSKKGSVDYQISDDDAIEPFIISFDSQQDTIKIGKLDHKRILLSDNKNNSQNERTEIIEIHPDENENHEFIFIGSNDQNKQIIIKNNSNDDEESKTEKSFLFKTDRNEETPLIFIDGKKVSRKEMKKIASEKIASINVLKGEKAIEKYGKEAKNGVIEIKTKNKS